MPTIERATAVLMANLKGGKIKPSDWIEIAEACRKLRKEHTWGFEKMTQFFGVSEYLLRQIDAINELNPEVKTLVKKRSPNLGLDESYWISRLPQAKQANIAKYVIDSKVKSKELRQLVFFLEKYPDRPFEEIESLFMKTRQKNIKLIVIPLNAERYSRIRESARKSGLKLQDFILKAIEAKMTDVQ